MSNGIPSEITMREAVTKRANAAPQGGVFFALVYTDENGVAALCEFDGCVCYEAFTSLEAAKRGLAITHKNLPKYAHNYSVRQVPAGIACYNRGTDTVERSGGTDEAFGVVFDCGFYSVTLSAPMVPQPVQQAQCNATHYNSDLELNDSVLLNGEVWIVDTIYGDGELHLFKGEEWIYAYNVDRMVAQPVQQAQAKDVRLEMRLIADRLESSGDLNEAINLRILANDIASDVPPAVTVIRSAQSIRDGLDPALVTRYRYFRRFGSTVSRVALKDARNDLRPRYPDQFTGWQTGRGIEARFIEQPGECGLRFVGYADEIVNLRHRGHFTDREICDQSLRGVVYQMASRKGQLLFIAGYEDANIDGACVFDFSWIHRGLVKKQIDFEEVKFFARDAAYAADGMAERAAEQECDYQESWRAGSDYVDAGTEYREARKFIVENSNRKINEELRRHIIGQFLTKREQLMTKRAELFEAYGNTDAFREHLLEQSN